MYIDKLNILDAKVAENIIEIHDDNENDDLLEDVGEFHADYKRLSLARTKNVHLLLNTRYFL